MIAFVAAKRSRWRSSPKDSIRFRKTSSSHGGLFNYNKARLAGESFTATASKPAARPMTIVEKIIARHAFVTAGKIGVEAVKPGDALFAVADVRFSHEYVTPMAESLFKQALGR